MFVLERHRPGTTDFERLWLGLIVLGAIAAAAWLYLELPTPVCVFHRLTDFPCLTCGGTRSMRSLLAGQPLEALAWNPLIFLTAIAVGAYALYASVVVALRLPRIRFGSMTKAEQNTLRIAIVIVLAANWIYLIRHFSRLD